jgi:bifunctional ADP-heptose synthase (sugar kinase/adenylyltransferase)
VARHMKTAGADVTFTTVLGNDEMRQFVMDDLEKAGVRVNAYVDPTRPTTHKERFIADGYKMLQVDRVDNRGVGPRGMDALLRSISETDSDLVIFSDFRHGIFNRQTIGDLRAAIPEGAIKAADSQVSNRWGNILDFTGFDLITPNEREARFALGDQDSVVRPLALDLFKRAECHYLILKLGERGLIAYRSPGPQPREFFTIDNFVEHLEDPIGAGDALLAYSSMAVARSNNIVIASILGTIGAAVVCERQGNTPVTPREVEEKIVMLERRAAFSHA